RSRRIAARPSTAAVRFQDLKRFPRSHAPRRTHRCRRADAGRVAASFAAEHVTMSMLTEQSVTETGAVAPVPSGVWAPLREARRGSRINYTTAPVGRAVVMLAIPMVMEMAMESIFAVVDVFWVAHLGADAVATVGLTESMLTIIYTAAMGLSIGAT